jgi:hypothetical protein
MPHNDKAIHSNFNNLKTRTMTAKEYLQKQGIHPTEPIYWYGEDDIITLEQLLESYHQAKLKLLGIGDVVLSLPDDEAIEQWWAEGKESDKFWQDAPYRTNGDVVEEIKTALKYFITVWQ